MAGAMNSGDWPEAGTGWELVLIIFNAHFFLPVREFFVLHRMVGRTQRGVLTPGYFEQCNFPSPHRSDGTRTLLFETGDCRKILETRQILSRITPGG